MESRLSDDELADRWECQELGGSGISHLAHVRVAWVLHRRHGAAEAEARLVRGTQRACQHYGVLEQFDERLTRQWARTVSAAVEGAPIAESFEEFIARHPQLRQGHLCARPAGSED